jgi:glycosyltransferase involved in cell wall biosynthesis
MSAPLRVALIASNRFPLRQPFAGGLEAHVWHLARALVERGHEVSLFAGSGSDLSLDCAELTVRELTLSAAAQADPSAPPMAFMADHHAYLNLMMHLADPHSGFDIVHNHSLHHLPVAMAPMLATPMITTLHTPPTPWLESALDVTGNTGTRFAAVSEHTADAWRHVAPDVTVVPNGVDFRRWPLGPGGDNLVWFGRITAEKGPHMAIAAARRAGLPLVLAGPVSDAAYFERAIAPSLGEHVRYAGHLNQDELSRLLGRSAVALITPMWDEPYGLVVAEAMSCGTPVVAFACGGIPEIVSPQSGRLVPPNDVDAMVDEIAAARSLPRIGIHRHAVGCCSAEAMVTAYLDLYRTTIDDRNEKTHDRLLRPPPRLRSPQSGHQHLRSTSPSGGCVDVAGHPETASVRHRPRASA